MMHTKKDVFEVMKGERATKKMLTIGLAVVMMALIGFHISAEQVVREHWNKIAAPPANNLDLLGYMFNLPQINVLEVPASGGSIYNWSLVNNHTCVTRANATSGLKTVWQEYRSMQQFVKTISAGVQVHGSYSSLEFSMSLSASMTTNYNSSLTSTFHSVALDIHEAQKKVDFTCYDHAQYFRSDFLRWFHILPIIPASEVTFESSWSVYREFIKIWGTHVLIGYVEGSQYSQWESTTSLTKNIANDLKIKACVSANGDIPFGGSAAGGACAQYSKQERQSVSNLATHSTQTALGGGAAERHALGAHPTPQAVDAFIASFGKTVSPMNLNFMAIWDIMTRIHLPSCLISNSSSSAACQDLQRAKNLEAYYAGRVAFKCPTVVTKGGIVSQWFSQYAAVGSRKYYEYACNAAKTGCYDDKACNNCDCVGAACLDAASFSSRDVVAKKTRTAGLHVNLSCRKNGCKCLKNWAGGFPQRRIWDQQGPISGMMKPHWLNTGLLKRVFPWCIGLKRGQGQVVKKRGRISSVGELTRVFGTRSRGDAASSLTLPIEFGSLTKNSQFKFVYLTMEKATQVMSIDRSSNCLGNLNMIDPSTLSAFGSLPWKISSAANVSVYEEFLKTHGEYVSTGTRYGHKVTVFGWSASGLTMRELEVQLCTKYSWMKGQLCSKIGNWNITRGLSRFQSQFGMIVRGGTTHLRAMVGNSLPSSQGPAIESFFSASSSSNGVVVGFDYDTMSDILMKSFNNQCVAGGVMTIACQMVERARNLGTVYFTGVSQSGSKCQERLTPQTLPPGLGRFAPVPYHVSDKFITNLYDVCMMLATQLVERSRSIPQKPNPQLRGMVDMMSNYTSFVERNQGRTLRLSHGTLMYQGLPLYLKIARTSLYLTPTSDRAGTELPNWNVTYPKNYNVASFKQDLFRRYYRAVNGRPGTQIDLGVAPYFPFFSLIAISSEVARDRAQILSVLMVLSYNKPDASRIQPFKGPGWLMMSAGGTWTYPTLVEGSTWKAKKRLHFCARGTGLEAVLNYNLWDLPRASFDINAGVSKVMAWLNPKFH